MKILNRTEFMSQPAGILYRKKMPNHSFGEIEIKGDNCVDVDFACMSFGYYHHDDETFMDLDSDISYPIKSDHFGRNGMFEQEATFLIYETWDLTEMKRIIDDAIKVAPKQVFKHPWDKD